MSVSVETKAAPIAPKTVSSGRWSDEEDAIILDFIQEHDEEFNHSNGKESVLWRKLIETELYKKHLSHRSIPAIKRHVTIKSFLQKLDNMVKDRRKSKKQERKRKAPDEKTNPSQRKRKRTTPTTTSTTTTAATITASVVIKPSLDDSSVQLPLETKAKKQEVEKIHPVANPAPKSREKKKTAVPTLTAVRR